MKRHGPNLTLCFGLFLGLFSAFALSANEQADAKPPIQLPALRLLEEAALQRAGLKTELIQRWQKRSRLAPALPRLQVGYEQKALQQNTAVIQDSISVTSGGVSIGPEANRVDQDFGRNNGFEVQAVWSLDELLFNRNELEVSREARDLLAARNQIVQELHQAYYELKTQLTRFQIDEALSEDPMERLKAEKEIDKIDSLTGGTFKRLLSEKKETSREEMASPALPAQRMQQPLGPGI